ncbi:hypothetical protein BN1708_000053 [Verticillium longisporum]|uniref:Glycosyltransferase 2-like domain-containing protein n=1 Tax=Verticillium longisporum TaxID=100787 RepID=A0A0G4KCG6_VERLO|nr:hypothetical protein BN1708_000053 [Verticillium longisporum]
MADVDDKIDETKSTTEVRNGNHVDLSTTASVDLINASGHVQQLSRNFSLAALAGVGLTVGNVWPAIGGSILVAIFNGGPPGVLYEFLAVSVCYWTVAASIAELASAIPSSAGVYHWASVTPGRRWGRGIGFFAGWWNYLAWVLGLASMSSMFGNTVVQMYALNHPDVVVQPWHVFVAYLLSTWLACAAVCLANKAQPTLDKFGIFAILGGFFITVIVVAVMPGRGGRPPHATSSFVWKEWSADIGYPDGFVFLAGMLNGAYSVGAVDATTHLAEEIALPHRNVPIAIGMQMSIGFVTGFCYLVAIMYGINDLDALFESPYPIAEIYRQATGSAAGATGLLALIMICIGLTLMGLYMICGRTLWALARDGATPVPGFLGEVNGRMDMPLRSTLVTAVLVTILGAIYVGSTTAFNALVGSFILTSSSSYLAAILPNLVTGRKNISYGPFHMRGWIGFAVNGMASKTAITMNDIVHAATHLSWPALALGFVALLFVAYHALLLLLHAVAPKPRAVLPSEKTYSTTTPDSDDTVTHALPCWFDRWLAERQASETATKLSDPSNVPLPDSGTIEPASVRVTVVIPAYNEEARILPALEEAVTYLDANFGRPASTSTLSPPPSAKRTPSPHRRVQNAPSDNLTGYEILIIDDGSSDATISVALAFARKHALHDTLRVVRLAANRGKGGAVTHGMRHARGEYVLFADADGASRFSDLGKLIEGAEEVVDGAHRGVAIGSRAHLVGSAAVVQRSFVRNFLMRSFHLVLTILTPPATSRLADTQCGFKLFTRAALPHVVPYMHAEGWIFDIEMLLLAESAPPAPVLGADGAVIGTSPGIRVAEVPIDWHEVDGSKVSLIADSIRMAVGLAVLRASWMMGVYRRRLT